MSASFSLLVMQTCALLPLYLEERDGLNAIFDVDRVARCQRIARLCSGGCRFANQNLPALRVLLKPRGCVHSVANRRVFASALASYVAYGRNACVHSYSDCDLRQCFATKIIIDCHHAALHGYGSVQRV